MENKMEIFQKRGICSVRIIQDVTNICSAGSDVAKALGIPIPTNQSSIIAGI